MSAKDKQRLAIAVGLVIVVAAVLYFLLFRPRAETPVSVGSENEGIPFGGAAIEPEGAPAPQPPVASGPPAPAVAQAPAQLQPEPSRPDPFALLFPPRPPQRVVPPPPPPPPLAVEVVGIPPVMVDVLPPIRLRPGVFAGVPQRRVAGVLWNDRVWAIIESDKITAVVQPGDVVEGNTVQAISPQGLILTSKGGKETEVPLRGRGQAPAPGYAPVSAPGGRPALPTMPRPM